MTNVLAVNAVVPKQIDTQYFLRATKQGVPIDNQVPRTYQVYTGTGNQTIDYDGSNEIRIFGPTLTGPLNINLGPLRRLRNMVGRILTINIIAPINQTITLSSAPAFLMINGTGLQQFTHVIPADNISKSLTVYFHSSSYLNVDYGASSTSVVPSTEPRTATLSMEYAYGTTTFISVPIFYFPDSTFYTLLYNDPEGTKEGAVVPLFGGIAGPGTRTLDFVYYPAPRRTDTTTVTGHLEQAGFPKVSFSCILKPILSNVYEHEYFIACNSNSTNTMYDPFVDTGSSPVAVDVNGNKVLTDMNPKAIAVDIADSLLFYVLDSSDTVIRWRSFTTGESGDLLDVATQPVSRWPSGRIQDIAFDEKLCTLLVLSTNSVSPCKILGIPIKPYDNNTPSVVNMGPVTCSQVFGFGIGSVPYSIAVCPISRAVYVATKQTPLTSNIIQLLPYPMITGTLTGNIYVHPTIITGAMAITCTAIGTLLIHFEATKELYRVDNTGGISTGSPISDVALLYTLPQFHKSLAPNCYGWRQG